MRAGFFPAMKALLLAYPVSVAFASNFLQEEAWPKFFAIINLAINTYSNASVKKTRLAALRRKYYETRTAPEEEKEASDADSEVLRNPDRPIPAPIPAPIPHIYSAVEPKNEAGSASQNFLGDQRELHSGPNNSRVGQQYSVLNSRPLPTRGYFHASRDYSSDSDEWEDIEPEEIPDRTPISSMPRFPIDSDVQDELSDSASEQENTAVGENPMRTGSFFTQTTLSDLDTDEESTESRTSLRAAATTATEFTRRPLRRMNSWTSDGISDSSSEEERAGSEIDSDTSTDLPRNPQQPRHYRRPQKFDQSRYYRRRVFHFES